MSRIFAFNSDIFTEDEVLSSEITNEPFSLEEPPKTPELEEGFHVTPQDNFPIRKDVKEEHQDDGRE